MEPDLLAAIQTIEHELVSRLVEAHELVSQFTNQNPYTRRLPGGTVSGLTTQLVKTTLADIEGVLPPSGAQAEHLLVSGDNVFSFRVHRARSKGSRAYDVQALSPRLNRITAGSQPDFLFLWVAENGTFIDAWAVVPRAQLAAQPGTQLAGFRQVRGQRWASAYRLPRLEIAGVAGLESLSPEPVVPDVDLGIQATEQERERRHG